MQGLYLYESDADNKVRTGRVRSDKELLYNAAESRRHQATLTLANDIKRAIDTFKQAAELYEEAGRPEKADRAYRLADKLTAVNAAPQTISDDATDQQSAMPELTIDQSTVPTPRGAEFIAPEMVRIPAGSFMMGSNNGHDDEKPMREVSVPAFEMARHELTWAEWEACEKDGGCNEITRPWAYFDNVPVSERPTHPVVNVDIDSVNEYLTWINEQTGLVYRLPSEAEWEYAARAGSTTAYSWGDDIGKNQANCAGCGSQWDDQSTAPVGSFQPNAFGLNDMHGNLWEWTADCWHSNYQGAPDDGSAWVDSCDESNWRPLRGGSWLNRPVDLRAANRGWNGTGDAIPSVGFRLARTLP